MMPGACVSCSGLRSFRRGETVIREGGKATFEKRSIFRTFLLDSPNSALDGKSILFWGLESIY